MHYRFRQAKQIGEVITDKAIVPLMDYEINAPKDSQQLLRIYNLLFSENNETITAEIKFESYYSFKYKESGHSSYTVKAFKIIDIEGNEVPYQIKKNDNNSFIKYQQECKIKKEIYIL